MASIQTAPFLEQGNQNIDIMNSTARGHLVNKKFLYFFHAWNAQKGWDWRIAYFIAALRRAAGFKINQKYIPSGEYDYKITLDGRTNDTNEIIGRLNDEFKQALVDIGAINLSDPLTVDTNAEITQRVRRGNVHLGNLPDIMSETSPLRGQWEAFFCDFFGNIGNQQLDSAALNFIKNLKTELGSAPADRPEYNFAVAVVQTFVRYIVRERKPVSKKKLIPNPGRTQIKDITMRPDLWHKAAAGQFKSFTALLDDILPPYDGQSLTSLKMSINSLNVNTSRNSIIILPTTTLEDFKSTYARVYNKYIIQSGGVSTNGDEWRKVYTKYTNMRDTILRALKDRKNHPTKPGQSNSDLFTVLSENASGMTSRKSISEELGEILSLFQDYVRKFKLHEVFAKSATNSSTPPRGIPNKIHEKNASALDKLLTKLTDTIAGSETIPGHINYYNEYLQKISKSSGSFIIDNAVRDTTSVFEGLTTIINNLSQTIEAIEANAKITDPRPRDAYADIESTVGADIKRAQADDRAKRAKRAESGLRADDRAGRGETSLFARTDSMPWADSMPRADDRTRRGYTSLLARADSIPRTASRHLVRDDSPETVASMNLRSRLAPVEPAYFDSGTSSERDDFPPPAHLVPRWSDPVSAERMQGESDDKASLAALAASGRITSAPEDPEALHLVQSLERIEDEAYELSRLLVEQSASRAPQPDAEAQADLVRLRELDAATANLDAHLLSITPSVALPTLPTLPASSGGLDTAPAMPYGGIVIEDDNDMITPSVKYRPHDRSSSLSSLGSTPAPRELARRASFDPSAFSAPPTHSFVPVSRASLASASAPSPFGAASASAASSHGAPGGTLISAGATPVLRSALKTTKGVRSAAASAAGGPLSVPVSMDDLRELLRQIIDRLNKDATRDDYSTRYTPTPANSLHRTIRDQCSDARIHKEIRDNGGSRSGNKRYFDTPSLKSWNDKRLQSIMDEATSAAAAHHARGEVDVDAGDIPENDIAKLIDNPNLDADFLTKKFSYRRNSDGVLFVKNERTNVEVLATKSANTNDIFCKNTGLVKTDEDCANFLNVCIEGGNVDGCSLFLEDPTFWTQKLSHFMKNVNLFIASKALIKFGIQVISYPDPDIDVKMFENLDDWLARIQNSIPLSYAKIIKNDALIALLGSLIKEINNTPVILNIKPSAKLPSNTTSEVTQLGVYLNANKSDNNVTISPSEMYREVYTGQLGRDAEEVYNSLAKHLKEAEKDMDKLKEYRNMYTKNKYITSQSGGNIHAIDTFDIKTSEFYDVMYSILQKIKSINTSGSIYFKTLLSGNDDLLYNVGKKLADNNKVVLNTNLEEMKDKEVTFLTIPYMTYLFLIFYHSELKEFILSTPSDNKQDDIMIQALINRQQLTVHELSKMIDVGRAKIQKYCHPTTGAPAKMAKICKQISSSISKDNLDA